MSKTRITIIIDDTENPVKYYKDGSMSLDYIKGYLERTAFYNTGRSLESIVIEPVKELPNVKQDLINKRNENSKAADR